MSDYISREQAIDVLKETGIIQDNDLGHLVVDEINRIPTLDEKEIIRKPMERIKERLNEIAFTENTKEYGRMDVISLEDALNIAEEEGGIE